MAVLANAKNASRLLVAVRVHAPGASNTIARRGEQKKNVATHTADKKAAP